jgi:deoxycytidine triphosphate deaminase
MSILYLPGRTTDIEKEYRDQQVADASKILVDETAQIESFSIELTVGTNWSESYGKTNAMVEIDSIGIDLASGRSVVIEVAERIGVPFNMYGLVIPTGSLFLDQGIIIAAAKIEPAFQGKLKLRLVNSSRERRKVVIGQKVASAIFFATDHTMFHADVTKRPVTVVPSVPTRRRFARWISVNRISVITWGITILVTIIGSSVTALMINRYVFGAPVVATPSSSPRTDNSAPSDPKVTSTRGNASSQSAH